LEDHLQSKRNSNLKLGKIVDKNNAFKAEIQTKDSCLVNKTFFDKRIDWMGSFYWSRVARGPCDSKRS